MYEKKCVKIITVVIIISLICNLIGCSTSSKTNVENDETKKIVDVTGDEIVIPKDVKTVINLVPYGCQIMIGLGLGDYLVGINSETIETSWIEEMYPRLKDIKKYEYEASAETLLNANADVVLVEYPETARDFRAKGINAVTFTYRSIDELEYNISLLGEILGTDAKEVCSKYNNYLNDNINMVKNALDGKLDKQETLYYINGKSDKGLYKTSGNGTTNEMCAKLAYTNFVTSDLIPSTESIVDSEAVLATNPENIIIGGIYQYRLYKKLYSSAEWSDIDAVKNNHVYLVPMGISAWNRYGIEVALMIPWLASTIYPEIFKYDKVNETINFYKTFTKYNLTEEQANYILNGLTPKGEKQIAD